MINKLIKRLFEPRHFWRKVGFDELSELYTAQFLRSLAVHLIGLFTPLYLYELGYPLTEILLYQVGWFMIRPAFDLISAHIVARIGPKHTMLLSAFIHVIYLSLLLTLSTLDWHVLLIAPVGSLAYSLHILAVQVDFSKIKHVEHGGKELSYMVIVERVGAILGPLAGGLIASLYDPRYTIGLAMLILLASTLPLFFTPEPVETNQKIKFKGMDWRSHKRDFLSVIPLTIENAVSIIVWPLYIGVFILGDNTFAKLGLIIALSTLSSIIFSKTLGNLIDDRKGRSLLRAGAVASSLVHLARPFVNNVVGATAVNIAHEPATAAHRIPYMKGLFDAADSLPGYRIAYITTTCIIDNIARLIFFLLLWAGMYIFEPREVLVATFFVAAVAALATMVEKFRALDK